MILLLLAILLQTVQPQLLEGNHGINESYEEILLLPVSTKIISIPIIN